MMFSAVGRNGCVPRQALGLTRPVLRASQPCRRALVVVAARRGAVADPPVESPPPKAGRKTSSAKKPDQPAPAAAPTKGAKAAPTKGAKAPAAPESTTKGKGKGKASTNTTTKATKDTTTTTTRSTGGKSKAGKGKKAVSAAAGLTETERAAAARVAVAIGRDLEYVALMSATFKRVLTEPDNTVCRHALLVQGASSCPAWWDKLVAASPATLARWLKQGEKRSLRMTYLAQKGLITNLITMSGVMRTSDAAWEAQHTDYKLWLQTQGVSTAPTRKSVNKGKRQAK